jgi:hypothetical protein
MSIGFEPSSVAPDASVNTGPFRLFPRSWHSAAKTLSESPLTELLCGSMSLGCCVSHSIWTWKMHKHEGKLYKKVLLWGNIVYQAPYDPEEKDMTEEEYRAHEATTWAVIRGISHPPHIGYASVMQKEEEQRRQQWEWNRFMRVY